MNLVTTFLHLKYVWKGKFVLCIVDYSLICTCIKSLALDGTQPIHNMLMYHISDFILYLYGWPFKRISK